MAWEPHSAMSTPGRDRAHRARVVLATEISEIAGSVRTRLPDLVDRVVRRILAEIEFYRDREVVSLQDLRDSVASNLESMVAQLTSDQPPDLSSPRVTGRRRAEQGTPLADILHAYRIGFTEFWEAIIEESRRSMRAPPDTLVDAASGVWWLIGEYTQELTVAYREAAAELLLAGARERSALVEALFTGGTPDRDTLWEAAKLLRLPWEGVFVVVAAEAPGLAQEGLPDVEALLAGRGIGSAWGCTPTSRPAWCRCAAPTPSPSSSGCWAGACAPGPASAPSITRWVTRPAPSITPGWSWAACPQEPRRSRSSSRPASGARRRRPGRGRGWCARCSDRSWSCPPRTGRAC